jgi:hypothetical protein
MGALDLFRISDFGFLSTFGFRPSAFPTRPVRVEHAPMKIAAPSSLAELEALRERLQRGLPAQAGYRWQVMIYKCRWGWVARAQLRRPKPPTRTQLAFMGG